MKRILWIFCLLSVLSYGPGTRANAESWGMGKTRPVVGTRGMVVSDDREASEWGAEILRRGGNAADAAAAAAFVLSVTRPFFASLGGGGFLIYCPPPGPGKPRPCGALDFREEAPGKASRDMYLKNGRPDAASSQDGPLASGVPGTPAGLLSLLKKFGTKSRAEILSRPIALAQRGFTSTAFLERSALKRWPAMNGEARSIFGCARDRGLAGPGPERLGGLGPCPPGTRIKQRDLAGTLRMISKYGRAGFYDGRVAWKLTRGLSNAGGIMTVEDLKSYRPKWRQPVTGHYRGMEIVSMPPPSSGGMALIQLLGFAERADKQKALGGGFGSAAAVHALAHAMSLAFEDRARYLGDPDFTSVPMKLLTSPAYLDRRWASFNPGEAFPADQAPPDRPGRGPGSGHTTHLSVMDRRGGAVSMTLTVNNYWGSGFVPAGTGVVMNDEMDDFSSRPGTPNMFGLIGGEANAIAPHKRPLSSLTPTIVRDPRGHNRIAIGAEGGPKIITAVFLSLVNRLYFGMALPDAVDAPRFHQQWRPADLYLEPFGFSIETREALVKLGYHIQDLSEFSVVYGLERSLDGRTEGAVDVRGEGAAGAE